MWGAVEESRVEVLLCYHHLFEILEQILKSTPSRLQQEKHHRDSGKPPVPTQQCLQHKDTEPRWLRRGSAPSGSQKAAGNCCPISQLQQRP